MGCYVELWPEQLTAIDGVRVLAGPEVKANILPALGIPVEGIVAGSPARQRTRAFVKVQDGCNNHCTYCVVCIARGRERSRPLEDILAEIAQLAGEGVQEIVLTGVHVGAYGHDLGLDLVDLVRAILDSGRVPRLRLSSIEPWHLHSRFLDLWMDQRLCRHLHLPLQSGCDATLRRMGRRYTTEEVSRLVTGARNRIPDLAITTDVMVGFPGETEAEFAESLRFVERMQFSRLHIFRYSRRPGTAAANFPDQVLSEISSKRSDLMGECGDQLGRCFRESMLGKTFPVLWETRDDAGGCWSGLTDNYIRVSIESDANLHNQISMVRLIHLEDGEAVRGALPETAELI